MDYDYYISYAWMRAQRPQDLLFLLSIVGGMPDDKCVRLMAALQQGLEIEFDDEHERKNLRLT